MRPEAEQRLRAGFQRRVDEKRHQYAAQLAHAGQLAARYECGLVVGVFSRRADVGRKTVITGLLPLVALPFLIVGAGAGVPGALPAFGFFLFLWIFWYAVTLWRARRRRVWCYTFTGGFVLLDDPVGDAVPVRWGQVTAVGPVWTQKHDPVAEEPRTVLGGYRLRTADGQAHEISHEFKNVEDPYHEMGQLFRTLAPNTIGTTMPTFPTIDQVITAYTSMPGPGALAAGPVGEQAGTYLNLTELIARRSRPDCGPARVCFSLGWGAVADDDPLILDFANGRVLADEDLDEYYLSGFDDESAYWDDIDLEDAFDLPPVLPPVRLPEEAELADRARQTALLAELRALAGEVRKETMRAAAVNPVLLGLAEEAELVERDDDENLVPGEDAGWLDDLTDDSDALDAWESTFAMVVDTTLEAADDSDPIVAPDLDLEGHGPALVLRLFLSWRDGVRVAELAEALKEAATAELEAEEADRQWQEWVDAHGDPLRLLLGQLERLGAISVTDDTARLEPLGVHAVRSKLERDGLAVPVLSAPDEMTADDVVLVFMHGSDDDFGAELASWTDLRGEEQAARELLAFAADEGAMTRTAAVTIAARLGQAAEPAWREALDRAELRCYAKPQLAKLAGLDPEVADLPAELQPERADVAWLIADTFGPFSHFDLGKEKFPFDFADLQRVSGSGKPDEVFEAIARLDHPDAEAVLAMIGKYASDKTTAKAARRAAYKASSRRAARR